MDSLSRGTLINGVSFTSFSRVRTTSSSLPSNLFFPNCRTRVSVRVSSSFKFDGEKKDYVIQKIKSTAGSLILTVATVLMIGKLSELPVRAETPVAMVEEQEQREERQEEREGEGLQEKKKESPLSQFIESHSEAIDALKAVLDKKLEDGEDEEALEILKRLVSAQPMELEWKFLMARLLNEMGEKFEARKVYQEILAVNPLCFDALFQNAVLMDQCGEGQAALNQLQETLKLAQGEQKEKEARDVRFILAQIQYLQKNIDEALKSYQELAEEDPKDYRPYFYQFVIYSVLDRNDEAKVQFAKCREVCPKDFKVEGFLQTPLSRTKLFGSDADN